MDKDVQPLADIVRRVDLDEVARRMMSIFQAEIPGYRALGESRLHADIEQFARRSLGVVLRSLVDGRPLSDEELVLFREVGRRRAAEGTPLEDLLHAFRLGARLGWEALVAVARDDEQDALLPCVARLMECVDTLSHEVTGIYHEQRRQVLSDEEQRMLELFVGLQDTAPLDPRTIELAHQIGFRLDDRYHPFCIALGDGPAHAHSQLAASLRQRGVLAVTSGDRVTGLLPQNVEPPAPNDRRALRAIGPPTPRAELAAMLSDLRVLTDVARHTGQTGDLRPEEFLPELLLARSPHLASMLESRVFGPLEAADERGGANLLATLEAFLEAALDRRAAADALHVHPNTLDYRLRRIEEQTGLRFADPDAVMLMALAIRRRRLEQPALVNGHKTGRRVSDSVTVD